MHRLLCIRSDAQGRSEHHALHLPDFTKDCSTLLNKNFPAGRYFPAKHCFQNVLHTIREDNAQTEKHLNSFVNMMSNHKF